MPICLDKMQLSSIGQLFSPLALVSCKASASSTHLVRKVKRLRTLRLRDREFDDQLGPGFALAVQLDRPLVDADDVGADG